MSEVKEHPILFSGEMVRAILDGRKIMTRRVVKRNDSGRPMLHGKSWHIDDPECIRACPHGQTGNRLWVRESWGVAESSFKPYACTINYFADNASKTVPGHTGIQYAGKNLSFVWRPSIHMPRWASRITLEITGVRVERLQEISVSDAFMEGIKQRPYDDGGDFFHSPTEDFKVLWDSLNAKRGCGWDENPWVWVVAFRRVEV